MAYHNDFGKMAEDLAADFILAKGYTLVRRNFRSHKAEIDIIAEYENQLIIIEVKARHTDLFIEPQEAVNKKKIRLMIAATNDFMELENRSQEVRFDIITVLPDPTGTLCITHIENAFESIDAN